MCVVPSTRDVGIASFAMNVEELGSGAPGVLAGPARLMACVEEGTTDETSTCRVDCGLVCGASRWFSRRPGRRSESRRCGTGSRRRDRQGNHSDSNLPG